MTEYIYCSKCADAVEAALTAERNKYLCAQRLKGWNEDSKLLPIIAGKVGGLYMNEEKHVFELELNDELKSVICHPLTVVVLPEGCPSDVTVFHLQPKKKSS